MEQRQISIIIGGSSGIGRECAKILVQKNKNVLITGRNLNKLKQAQKELGELCSIEPLNLYKQDDVNSFIDKINSFDTPIEHLVNSAGYFKPVSFLDHTDEDYNLQLDINKSFFFISQAVAKKMKENKNGSIVNIGSMWAHQAVKATPSSAYSMQKAGLHSLTQHMAMELAEFNIRVNAVAPAVVLTTIYKSFIEEDKIEASLADFNSFHPLGRIGHPVDIAKSIDFLLSDNSSWITGEVLNVDGGVMSGRN